MSVRVTSCRALDLSNQLLAKRHRRDLIVHPDVLVSILKPQIGGSPHQDVNLTTQRHVLDLSIIKLGVVVEVLDTVVVVNGLERGGRRYEHSSTS